MSKETSSCPQKGSRFQNRTVDVVQQPRRIWLLYVFINDSIRCLSVLIAYLGVVFPRSDSMLDGGIRAIKKRIRARTHQPSILVFFEVNVFSLECVVPVRYANQKKVLGYWVKECSRAIESKQDHPLGPSCHGALVRIEANYSNNWH
ncbi:hypothetical protein TNIN_100371 [Trichonephila inaurata madagascariensis]|uniref:Uncharacterized protein n=1 Tax=Trichonephila inaurata madagascariensis TaxID=2747483 RepID=A0A8X6YEJ4_9ARAC|nr:hypothetical protein TNIN_100371 [Trichonephila inaurata madagascariensis]